MKRLTCGAVRNIVVMHPVDEVGLIRELNKMVKVAMYSQI